MSILAKFSRSTLIAKLKSNNVDSSYIRKIWNILNDSEEETSKETAIDLLKNTAGSDDKQRVITNLNVSRLMDIVDGPNENLAPKAAELLATLSFIPLEAYDESKLNELLTKFLRNSSSYLGAQVVKVLKNIVNTHSLRYVSDENLKSLIQRMVEWTRDSTALETELVKETAYLIQSLLPYESFEHKVTQLAKLTIEQLNQKITTILLEIK